MNPPPCRARPRILVVDDNRAIHEDFRKIFGESNGTELLEHAEACLFGEAPAKVRSSELRIDSAYQGQEGLLLLQKALAEGDPYALAFVDVRMPPGWDGIESIARFWEVYPDLQVVVCTAYSDYSWEDMNLKLGHTDRLVILKKPFDNVEVLQLAGALSEKWHLLQLARQHTQELESTIAKRTEQLRKSEERFRLITENVADLIAIVDANGQRLYNSPSYERILGYTTAELQATSAFDQVHPEDRDRVIAAKDKTIESGIGAVLEYRMRHKEGSWQTLESHGVPFRDAQGRIEGVLTIARDVSERKRVEDSLCASEQMLRLVLDTIPVRVFWKNRSSVYLGCNRLFANDAGLTSPFDLIGKLDSELTWRDQAEQYFKDDQRFMNQGEARLHYEETQTTPAGDTLTLRTSKIPMRDPKGSIIGILGIYEDITELKKSEEMLRLREAALRAAANSVVITNRQGLIVWTNAAFTKETGYTAEEVLGQNPRMLKGADHTAAFYQDLWKTIASGQVWHGEFHNRRKDGTPTIEDATITPVRNEAGHITHFIAVKQNITERKQAELKLRESEGLLQSALDAIPMHIAILDSSGVIIGVNAMWRSFAEANNSTSRAFCMGYNYLNVCECATGECSTEAGAVAAGIKSVMANRQSEFRLEYPCHSPSEQRWFLMRVTRFGDEGPVRLVVAHENITERVKAERERTALELHLRHAQKLESIGQLAAGVAHEINTPTQYIGDNTQFLRDSFKELVPVLMAPRQLLDALRDNHVTAELLLATEQALAKADVEYLLQEIPKAVDQSLQGIERVATIVRAMKEFSHPGTEDKTQVDLNHCIESTLTVARNEWKYVADLVTEYDATLPPVTCLPGEFNQVILNLTVNAAHAIADTLMGRDQAKGLITISTRRDGDWVEIRVRDSGTGIPESARGKIFDPFFTTKGVGKGTGQGLAIAHSVIVDKHGGTITFETELGTGTVFIIRIPISPAKASVLGNLEKTPEVGV